MNRHLQHRVAALEGHVSDPVTVFASVPSGWPEDQRQSVVTALAKAAGVAGRFDTCIIADGRAREARITHVGSMRELMDHVTRHGRRLGDSSRAVTKEASA